MCLWRSLLGVLVLTFLSATAGAGAPLPSLASDAAAACGPCEGKVHQLTLRYRGTVRDADVEVRQRDRGDYIPVFHGTVQPQGTFSFSGRDKKETLGPEIRVWVNGVQNARIQTSCETPIGPGLVVGDFEVVEGTSRVGGPLCPSAPPPPRPTLRVIKTDILQTDADGSGTVTSGDMVRYTAIVSNPGTQAVGHAVYHDAPGAGTRLVAGSVVASRGTVSVGNAANDTTVTVDAGTLASGESFTVTFDVTVGSVSAGVAAVSNQGYASGDGVPGVPTDDPETPQAGDPTLTVLGSRPYLDAVQTVTLQTDADGSSGVSAGDTLLVSISLRNAGTAPATGVAFGETPGGGTHLVAGSVTAPGSVTTGNGAGDASVAVDLGTLPAGDLAVISYQVTVDAPIASGTAFLASQGLIRFNEDPAGEATDDPATLADDDATRTPVQGGGVLLSAVKLDTLLLDVDGDGQPGPGDALRYLVIVTNAGDADATGVIFIDTPGAHTVLAVGTVAASDGTVTTGNAAGDVAVRLALGTIPAGKRATAAFTVAIDNPLPAGVDSVANQGSVTSNERSALATDDPATAAAGDTTVTRFATLAALGGFVWGDSNANGIQDAGEPGLGGITVRLLDGSGNPLQTTATGADGSYRFEGLAPGDYIVEFAARTGYGFSPRDQGSDDARDSDADPATGRTAVLTLAGGDHLTVDAGLVQSPVLEGLGDFVWDDLDGDGIQDAGEPGLAGIPVRLLHPAGTELATTVTGVDGSYRFEELAPGDYAVEFTAPLDFALSPRDRGSDDELDSDADPITGRTGVISLPPTGGDASVDAGLYRQASLTGFVWDDGNGDGLQNSTERGLSSAAVELLDSAGGSVASGSTDAGGAYRFSRLAPGAYSVHFVSPAGFAFSPRDAGSDDGKDSDADPTTGRSAPVLLEPGEEGTDVDAGFFQPITGLTSSPGDGETGVALTRETIFRLSSALADSTVVDGSRLFAEFGGSRLAARIHVSPDRHTVTLFYDQPLPASARVRVTFIGDGLPNEFGSDIDADGDGQPGGVAKVDFDTLSLATVPGTRVCGRVFASELAPGDSGSSVNVPLQGVTIHVEGNDALRAVTDSLGNFCLDPAPAGRFFVLIDGRTASNGVPPGTYYPSVGKAWESVAGQEVNTGNVFLPLVPEGTLQPVSRTADTPITFAPSVLAQFPELAGAEIMVPADSLYADDGTRGGQVGIAPVPPDRIPGALPPGLDFPIVITVQTDGATNFDVPLPACLPNLPDPATGKVLQPGEKSALWSFNHDTGEFEVVGPMTVTADGRLVCTDPGVGIQAPGWHGAEPGSPNDVQPEEPEQPNDPPDPEEPEEPEDCDTFEAIAKASSLVSSAIGLAAEFAPIAKGVTCAIELFNGTIQIANDLKSAAETGSVSCVALNLIKVHLDRIATIMGSCVPGTDTVSKLNTFCERASSVLGALSDGGELAACLAGTPLINQLSGLVSQLNEYVGLAVDAKQRLLGVADPKEQLVSLTAQLLGKIDELACSSLTSGSTITLDQKTREDLERVAALLEQVAEADVEIDPETADLSRQVADLIDVQRTAVQQFTPAELTNIVQKSGAVKAATDLVGRRIVRLFSKPVARPVFAAIAYDDIVLRRTIRGRSQQVLPPNTLVRISLYDPQTNGFTVEEARSEESGRVTKMGSFVLMPATDLPDADGDGLADDAEFVVGTRADHGDSDGDGINDFAEVRQGTDPLNGALVRTGIIATADTPGTAVDVCALNDITVVADSQAGVSVFNAFNGMEPRIVAQVDTPGTAQAVSCGTSLIAVADGAAGLAVVDVSDPPAARILHQVDLGGSARAVTVAGNIAFVGLDNGQLVSVDMASGTILERVAVGGAIQDVTINGDTLYALTVGNLYALPLFNGPLQVAGSAGSPGSTGAGGRRLRLFAGGTIAYATHTSGYNTFDLTDPLHPRLITAGRTSQFGWKQIVANGSGLGVAAVDPNSTNDGAHDVSLYDVSDPNQTDVFLTRFETPGLAAAVSIYNGLAYVADSQSGLQVVNYLPYDAQGVAPTITLSTNFAAGMAEEGKLIRVTADVDDDVQVRNVEFYVDGVKVVTDGNFPFEHRFTTPLLSQQATFTLGACATDTGGNRTCTVDAVVTLTTDATPPRVTSVAPQNGASVGQGTVSAVSAGFSEPIDGRTLSGTTFSLFTAGPDGIAGNADDVAVTGGTVSYREDVNTAFLTFPAPLAPELYRAVLSGTVTDLAGNPVGADSVWTFRIRGPQSWINPEGGRWSDPANWSEGVVPGPSDIAFITLAGNYTVLVDRNASAGSLTLGGLSGSPTLWVAGNSTAGSITLTVNNDFNSSGILRIESQGSNWSSQVTVGGLFSNTGTIDSRVGSGGPRTISGNLVNLGNLFVNQTLTLFKAGGVYANEGEIQIASGQSLVMSGQSQVFRQNNGRISGFGGFNVASAVFEFNGGEVAGIVPLLQNSTLSFGPVSTGLGSFILTGASARILGNIAAGQTVWVRGDSTMGNANLTAANGFTNAGTLRLESIGSNWESKLTVTNGILTNTGTILSGVGSGGPRTISADFVNRGDLQVNQAVVLSRTNGVYANERQITIAAGQKLSLSGQGQRLVQNGGTIEVLGGLDVISATLDFNGGSFSGTMPLLQQSTLNLGPSSGAGSFILTGVSAKISGNVAANQTVWVRGDSAVGNANLTAVTSFTNAGTLRLESIGSNWESKLTVTSGTLINLGTLLSGAGTGGPRTISGNLLNRGTFQIDQTLVLTRLNGVYANEGQITIATDQKLSLSSQGQAFSQDGGTIAVNGGLDVISATINFNGGSFSGNTPLLQNSTLNIGAGSTGAGSFLLTGVSARLSGNIAAGQTVWVRGDSTTGNANLTAANGFTNAGTLRLESIGSNWESKLTVTSGTLVNTGSIVSGVGTGGARTIAGDFTNQGTLDVNQSVVLTRVNGSYANEGQLNIATGQKLSYGGQGQVFTQRAGVLRVNGSFEVGNATYRFEGGTYTGNSVALTNSTLALTPAAGPATFVMSGVGSQLGGDIGPGQTVWVRGDGTFGNANLTSANGFTNAGTLRIESIGSNWESKLTVTSGTLVNTGSIVSGVGTGGARTIVGDLMNQGTLDVNQSLVLTRVNGSYVNEGQLNVAAGQKLSYGGQGQVFTQRSGTLAVSGSFEVSNAAFRFEGGTFTGNPVALANSTLTLTPAAGPATFVMNGGSSQLGSDIGPGQTVWVRGDGTFGNANLTSANGFTNAGTLRLESIGSNWESKVTVTNGTLTNTGVIQSNTGSGGARTIAAVLDNQGTINVNQSLTATKTGGAHSNSGTIAIASGQTFLISGSGTFTNTAGGTIAGNGTLSAPVAILTNAGTLSPGSSPGILGVAGNLTQGAAGAINVEIGGTVAGSQFDQLNVSGAANLGGTLNVSIINGFTPAQGQTFRVVGWASRTGTFGTITGLDLGGGLRLDPSYGATGLTLTVVPSP